MLDPRRVSGCAEEPGLWGGVLAAGESRRMGSPKALLRWGHQSLLEHACSTLLKAGVSHVVVALRSCDAGSFASEAWWCEGLSSGTLSWVVPEQGALLGASVMALLRASCGRPMVIHQMDRPFVEARHIARLIEAHRTEALPAIAKVDGVLMPPVVVPSHFAGQVGALPSDLGLASLFRTGLCAHVAVDFETEESDGFGTDVDTPADWRAALQRRSQIEQDGKPDARNEKHGLPR